MLIDSFTSLYLGFCFFVARHIGFLGSPDAGRISDHVLRRYPLIDLHVDLPELYRSAYQDDVSNHPYDGPLKDHVDLPRLREGHAGGFFSIAYADCLDSAPDGNVTMDEANRRLVLPSNLVRDALEQIDVTHQLVAQNGGDVGLALSPTDVRTLHRTGKLSHLIGVEGAHLIGNSLAVLRTFHRLGARYLTLTHTCHNAFADTAGTVSGIAARPLHNGLSAFGRRLVAEMNRIGLIVDVSHTSDQTARQAIQVSRAPVLFTHSGARSIHNHVRNVPDDILRLISEDSGRDGVVGVPFLPDFVSSEPTLEKVADHIDHIARIAGKSRVAIGSDFDGFGGRPIENLKDVRDYRNLLNELIRRGWREKELAGLLSGNFLRIFRKVEATAASLHDQKADMVRWDARDDKY